jgi:hypothetical protein
MVEEKFKEQYGVYSQYYYLIKIKECEKMYSFLYIFETTLKNKLEKELIRLFGEEWKSKDIFLGIREKDKHGKIKEITLGFWVKIFSSYYHELIWNKGDAIKNTFPFLEDKKTKNIYKDLQKIKAFRNKIFHFEYDIENITFIQENQDLVNKYIHGMTDYRKTMQNPALLTKDVALDFIKDCAHKNYHSFTRNNKNNKTRQKTFNTLFENLGVLSKYIDCKVEIKEYKIYIKTSFLMNAGGAQDNQYKDIQDFLNHSRDCNEKNAIFLAICDGDYYLQKDSKTGDETKIKRLERLTDRKTSFALKIDDLKDFLEKF